MGWHTFVPLGFWCEEGREEEEEEEEGEEEGEGGGMLSITKKHTLAVLANSRPA
jgi:hypothetical protein